MKAGTFQTVKLMAEMATRSLRALKISFTNLNLLRISSINLLKRKRQLCLKRMIHSKVRQRMIDSQSQISQALSKRDLSRKRWYQK
jgi:hypothetical protein